MRCIFKASGGGAAPNAADLRKDTVVGAVTGTLAVPPAAQTLYGVPVDATTGTLTLPNTDGHTPNAALVVNTAHFGPGNTTAGTLDMSVYTLTATAVAAVTAGQADILNTRTILGVTGLLDLSLYNLASAEVWPAENKVDTSVTAYGPTGAEYAGSLVPAETGITIRGGAGTNVIAPADGYQSPMKIVLDGAYGMSTLNCGVLANTGILDLAGVACNIGQFNPGTCFPALSSVLNFPTTGLNLIFDFSGAALLHTSVSRALAYAAGAASGIVDVSGGTSYPLAAEDATDWGNYDVAVGTGLTVIVNGTHP